MRFYTRVCSGLLASALCAMPAMAGVVNPDISAIGQLHLKYTDDQAATTHDKPDLTLGESEVVFDAALNPYSKGMFVFSFGDGGVDVEEAYMTFVKGLPWGLNVKAGKYRLGFGKINPVHPHAYPFIETPRVLDPAVARLLPGDESFNEVAVQVSDLLPTPGDWASILSFDVIRGSGFHPDSTADQTALGWLARWSNSFLLGEQSAMELGLSATQGTNNIERETKTTVLGADAKAKLFFTPTESLVLQAEALDKLSDEADAAGAVQTGLNRYGFYGMADYHFWIRYNAGFIYDQYQSPADKNLDDRAVKVFAGFSVLEESTLIRVSYEYFMPEEQKGVNTFAAQLLYSMGPHKAHQF
jgi:hypothetical protein